MLVLLVFVVDIVCSSSFDGIVDAVATNMLTSFLHEVEGPVLISVSTTNTFVVFNHLNSVL